MGHTTPCSFQVKRLKNKAGVGERRGEESKEEKVSSEIKKRNDMKKKQHRRWQRMDRLEVL